MSQKEFQRVKVIENAVAGRLSVGEAARLLQLSERQVQRLKRRYRPDSVAWVHHGNRGRPMPWALPAAQHGTILELAHGQISVASTILICCQKLHSERASVGQPQRPSTPHSALRQIGIPAEAPPSPVPALAACASPLLA